MMMASKIVAYALLLIVLQFCNAHKHTSLRGGDHEEQARMTTADDSSPTLTNCLLSAVNSNDCGTIIAGCIWCAEPIYGLCVSETAAIKMKVMPFFKCDLGDVASYNTKNS